MPIPDSHYDAAIAAENRGDFATAEREYLAASKVFGARGDSNTRDYYASLAKLCHQDVRLMVDQPDENIRRRQILARNEPSTGCFLGACIDRDDAIRKVSGDNGQFHGDWSDFDKRIGRRHATAFMYLSYGRPAPVNWLGQLERRGMGGQIVMDIKDITQRVMKMLRSGTAVIDKLAQAAMLNGSPSRAIRLCCKPPFQWLSILNRGKPLVRS